MTRRVISINESPPGYWRYTVPETGKLIGPFPAFSEIRNAVAKYYQTNTMLAPGDIDDKIHEQMCAQIHPSLCEEASGAKLLLEPKHTNKTLVAHFNTVVAGTMTIGEWFIKGRLMGKEKLVPKEQANARAVVCSTCPHNVPVGRCAPCVAGRMVKAVERIVGNAKTDLDDHLQACNLCGCSLKAKVWFPLDLLRKHMTAEHIAQFPDFCWLQKEAQ